MQLSEHHPIRKLRTHVPNMITVGAILAGYLSILVAFHGDFLASALLILVACLLDMLDGRIARAMKITSEFGIEFDSLADMVNFGLAPSLLFYQMYFREWGLPGMILSFLPVCCAGIRLARFNCAADPDIPTTYYVGLPTTVAAAVMAGFILFITNLPTANYAPQAAVGLTVFVALLMVSNIQYEKSNILSPRYIRKTGRIITGGLILLSLVVFPQTAFFAWGLSYILYGVVRSAVFTIRYGRDDSAEKETADLL